MAKKKKTNAEQIANIPIETIAKLGGEAGIAKLRKYVQILQTGYKRRVGQFKRKGLTSYAQISLEGSMSEPAKKRKVKDMTRNQLLMEFARYSKFFNDVTSTVEGIKKVNMEQDIRLYGADTRGTPNLIMSDQQRKDFWTAYDEFINNEKDAISRFGSERVQQAVAQMIREERSVNYIQQYIDHINKILEEKSKEESADHGPNVYSGRGPTFQ